MNKSGGDLKAAMRLDARHHESTLLESLSIMVECVRYGDNGNISEA